MENIQRKIILSHCFDERGLCINVRIAKAVELILEKQRIHTKHQILQIKQESKIKQQIFVVATEDEWTYIRILIYLYNHLVFHFMQC